MMRTTAAIAAGLVVMAGSARAAPEWPVAADIPKPAPVALGLAGEGVDVTRYLLVRGASAFDLSPDGRTVFYASNVTGDPQLWSVPATGGWPIQLTFGSGIDSALALPGGEGVLYGADTGGDERQGFYVLSADGRRERVLIAKSEAFRQIGDVSRDGRVVYASTERNGRDFDIHVADLKTGASKLVYQGSFGFFPRAWQPGGNLVVVSEVRGEDAADLHLLDVSTGKLELLFRPKVAAAFDSFEWLPDGSGFFLASNLDREFQNLAFYDLKARKIRFLETEPHDVTGVSLSGDGRYLAWVTEVEGYSRLTVLDRTTDRKLAAPALPAGVYGVRFAEAAPVLGIRVVGAQSNGEVFTWNVADGTFSRPVATNWAGLDPASMVTPEAVTFKARDGVTLHGLFYAPKLPPGAPKPPLVLNLHGGPSAHAVPGYTPHLQYFAARGIAVFDLNYRGSTGFGKTFARLNDKRLRVNELGDLADAVAYMRKTGRVDPARAAVMGGSYGGYLTNAAVGAYPDLFVAGASFVGVSDWVKALEGAGPELKASDRQEYGDIDNPADRAFFASISPINNAAKIRTPLLVEHGANDPRDPVTESDRLVEAVRRNGTEVVYLRFPDEGHSVTNLANRVHMWRAVAAFLERKFGMSAATPAR